MSQRSTKPAKGTAKAKLAESFIDLVLGNPKPQERISVTDVCRTLGIDRKTFYNYFENTSDLIVWIFRSDLAERLEKPAFAQSELVYPREDLHDKYADLPFYARFRTPEGHLKQNLFFQELTDLFNANHGFYYRILAYDCYIDFYLYIQALYMTAITEDVVIIAGESSSLSPEAIEFLGEYHTNGLFGRFRYHFVYQKQRLPVAELTHFWNYAHETIRSSIKALERGSAS